MFVQAISTLKVLVVPVAAVLALFAAVLPHTTGAQPAPTTDEVTLSLSEHELEQFRVKALDNVKRLEEYIRVVADKGRPRADKDDAVDLALLLFTGEDAIVEVSSVSRPHPRKLSIRSYLSRLMELDYSRVEITWADIAYASDFERGPDGRYYAVATITQRFAGYDDGDRPVYEDVTVKQITVVLQPILIQRLLDEEREWDVLLRDISVTQTRTG